MFESLFDRIRSLKHMKLESAMKPMEDNTQNLRPKSIDNYRHKFLIAPLGYWHQTVGTFGAICNEEWEFQSDRTGKVIYYSALSGEREIQFEWQEVAELTIACRVTKWIEETDPEDLGFEREESEEWQTIRYDFKIVPTDAGDRIGMYEIRSDGTIDRGFWHSLEPLSFSRDL
jgi:hypothetical protein